MKIVRYELSQYRYPTFLVVNLKAVRWVDLESLSENFVAQLKDSAIQGSGIRFTSWWNYFGIF